MKVALVTGAAQGLGLVTASHLAKLGLRVILSDLQDLAAASARLRSSGAEVEAAQGDISSEAFVRDLAARIERDHRALDVLVNNAGISLIAPAEDTTADQRQRVMNVNLFGPFLLCKYLGAQMLGRRAGSIVNARTDANSRSRVGWTWSAGKRGLSGVDQNRDGRRGSAAWRLLGSGHHRSRALGSLRRAR